MPMVLWAKSADYDKHNGRSHVGVCRGRVGIREVEAEKSRFANICLARSDHVTLVKTMTMHAARTAICIVCSFAPAEKSSVHFA